MARMRSTRLWVVSQATAQSSQSSGWPKALTMASSTRLLMMGPFSAAQPAPLSRLVFPWDRPRSRRSVTFARFQPVWPDRSRQTFRFSGVDEPRAVSLNRGFSAPVTVTAADAAASRAFLMAHDSDPFNRWEAAQQFAADQLLGAVKAIQGGGAARYDDAFIAALGGLLRDATPAPGSALLGAGDPAHVTQLDLNLKERTGPVDAGAVDGD